MSNDELEKALVQKMSQEQETLKNSLLRQAPEQILASAREYVTKENILKVLGSIDTTPERTKTLLQSDTPLDDIYREMQRQGTDYGLNEIMECIESLTGRVQAEEAERRNQLLSTPVYPHSASYARENGELEQYRASYRANVACRDAIDAAISEHYYDNALHTEAVKQVVETFGFDRMLYVLANSIQHREGDERISPDSVSWSKTFPIYDDGGAGRNGKSLNYSVEKSHSIKLDLFVKAARHKHLLTMPLTAEDISTEAKRVHTLLSAAPEPNSPGRTHFIAEVSPDFVARAKPQDLTAFRKMFPYKSFVLTTMNERKGVFAAISGDEDRNKKLREPRASVMKKLREPSSETQPNYSAKLPDMEME